MLKLASELDFHRTFNKDIANPVKLLCNIYTGYLRMV